MKNEKLKMLLGGGIIGILAVFLVKQGNPGNMGICVACFWRDIAGALGLHRAAVVQYIRPEIIGFIFGAFASSVFSKDFKARGGSSPLIRFLLGVFMAIGALVFLGCPLRMILRLANGDLNALIGTLGFVVGIIAGLYFLKNGYTLGRNKKELQIVGYIMPLFAIMLLVFLVIKPEFIFFSEEGPGSMHAPILISLVAGIITGVLLQRTRVCSAGAFRDLFLIKDMHFMYGIIGIFIAALIGNLTFGGSFKLSFEGQPVAHSEHIWNFLGMTLVGFAGILLGGCPIRQTILAGDGDADAGITIFGLLIGAAIAHNFGLAASPKGAPLNGRIAVIIGLILCTIIAYIYTNKRAEG